MASIWTTNKGGSYATPSGTSIASPVIAGVISLMMSANPALSSAQIESILFSTAKDLGTTGFDIYYGHGRVDAQQAVQAAVNSIGADSQSPTVAIANPLSGSVAQGIIVVNAIANDNVSVSRVELYAGGTLIGSDTQSPYNFSLDTTIRPDGSLTLTTKAYDAAGNTSSSSIAIIVDNIEDTQAPVISIITPINGSIVKNSVSISATATDNEGVSNMSLYIDGVLKANSSSGSISTTWNTRKVSSGTHTIKVEARDSSGNLATSSIQVTK